jgi:hypothetical protein
MFTRIPLFAKVAAGAGGAGLLALGALTASAPVLAAATPSPQASAQPGQRHDDHRQDRRQIAKVVFAAEASVLGVKPEELRQDLKQGKTVSELAQAKGMNEQQFGQAVAKAAKPGLDQLVDTKKITAGQEARVLQRLNGGHVPFWNGLKHKSA